MSFVKDIFGGKSSQQQTVQQQRLDPLNIFTTTSGGGQLNSRRKGSKQITSVTLPSIIDSERDQVRSGFESILDQVQGRNSSFIQAAMNPLIERLSGIPGQVERNLGRRNVVGSLANNEIRNAEIDVARALGDARTGLEERQLGLQGNILTNMRGLTQDRLQQELAALGLSSGTINSVIASQLPTGSTSTGQASNPSSGLGSIGGLLTGISTFFD